MYTAGEQRLLDPRILFETNCQVARFFTRNEMPRNIDREEVQRLLLRGAQLVEVLPAEVYQEAHLPGAINIPLKTFDAQSARQLDAGRPLITYCRDFQ